MLVVKNTNGHSPSQIVIYHYSLFLVLLKSSYIGMGVFVRSINSSRECCHHPRWYSKQIIPQG